MDTPQAAVTVMLKRLLRNCRHHLSNLTAGMTLTRDEHVRFRCNICGRRCVAAASDLTRAVATPIEVIRREKFTLDAQRL